MRVLTPHPVTEPDCELAEGPLWYDHTLTWVGIPRIPPTPSLWPGLYSPAPHAFRDPLRCHIG